jgi:hypothetical protein
MSISVLTPVLASKSPGPMVLAPDCQCVSVYSQTSSHAALNADSLIAADEQRMRARRPTALPYGNRLRVTSSRRRHSQAHDPALQLTLGELTTVMPDDGCRRSANSLLLLRTTFLFWINS